MKRKDPPTQDTPSQEETPCWAVVWGPHMWLTDLPRISRPVERVTVLATRGMPCHQEGPQPAERKENELVDREGLSQKEQCKQLPRNMQVYIILEQL